MLVSVLLIEHIFNWKLFKILLKEIKTIQKCLIAIIMLGSVFKVAFGKLEPLLY